MPKQKPSSDLQMEGSDKRSSRGTKKIIRADGIEEDVPDDDMDLISVDGR